MQELVENSDLPDTLEQSIEEFVDSADIEKRLSDTLSRFQAESKYEPLQDEGYKTLLSLTKNDDEAAGENGEIEMMETEFFIPIDPFSRKPIVIPVKNKNCGHLYDKDQFYTIFESRNRNRFVVVITIVCRQTQRDIFHCSAIKCPVTGCSNVKVTIADVEEDLRTKIMIENAKNKH